MSKSSPDFEAASYLRHMLDELEYLSREGEGLKRDTFLGDETRKRAFVRSLEVIGEAAKKLPLAWRKTHHEVDWRAIAGMRDRLIHGYFGVDYEIVWDVVVNHAPELRERARALLTEGEA